MTGVEATCTKCGNRYVRLPRAKSGLCCGCRRLKRKMLATERRPVPDVGAFQTQAALVEWYSEDKLRCHICGDSFAGLYRHVPLAHGITTRDYKMRFGIPMTYGLSGAATRGKQRVCGSATTEKMRSCGYANLEKARRSKTGTRAAWTPYQARGHAVLMVESPNHPSQHEGEVEVICTRCATPFPLPASIALAFQCRATCPQCTGK